MSGPYRVSIKQSVCRATGLDEEEYDGATLAFESESDAESWVAGTNAKLSTYGQLVLHTAHPNDNSGVDAYLVFKEQPVWTTDE